MLSRLFSTYYYVLCTVDTATTATATTTPTPTPLLPPPPLHYYSTTTMQEWTYLFFGPGSLLSLVLLVEKTSPARGLLQSEAVYGY